jgi:two-component system OmpR family response regulator
LAAGKIRLDQKTKKVLVGEEEVRLLPKELGVLEFLMRHKGQVFSSESILNHVWSSESEVTSEAFRQCLTRLRKKIDRPGEPSVITTVIGLGYTIK